jgi:hypothetical protein
LMIIDSQFNVSEVIGNILDDEEDRIGRVEFIETKQGVFLLQESRGAARINIWDMAKWTTRD